LPLRLPGQSAPDNYQDKKKRKGVKNTELYKHVVIKKAKVKGLLHENHAGKIIMARKTGDSCK
jgi:hypothetical protein